MSEKPVYLDLSKPLEEVLEFELNKKTYSIVNTDGERIIQPGKLTISIGGSQPGFTENVSKVLKGSFKIK